MKGTEKQIAWAQDIIGKAIAYCDKRIEYLDKWATAGVSTSDDCMLYAKIWRVLKAWVITNAKSMDDAARIIDSRSYFAENTMDNFAYKIRTLVDAGQYTLEQIAEQSGIKDYAEED